MVEVKSGTHVGISVLPELRGVLEDDQALMAGLVVMNLPKDSQVASFGRFIASVGDLEVQEWADGLDQCPASSSEVDK